MQEEVTRGSNNLDLFFTNRPGLVKQAQTIPGISDHDVVVIDTDIKAKINKCKPRKVYRFKDANWEMIRDTAKELNRRLIGDLMRRFSIYHDQGS